MCLRKLAVPALLAVLSLALAIPSMADSQARIVRLSQVEGEVQIDRNIGQGYEKAFLNLPVIQGSKLRTGADSRAEIEFEDGTTLRVTPGSVVEFPELGRHDSGARTTSVELQQGTAYLNFKGDPGGQFSLAFGRERLSLSRPAHLRVEIKDANATVAVFSGEVEVESPQDADSKAVSLAKKHSATFDLSGTSPYTVANNLEPDPYDDWDKQQQKYQQQYSANNYSPYAYGASDLNYYGSFYNMPGYGMMWQPFLVGAGWDPFMNGAWMWYPGAGYAWISSYPWGWTPYRYGSWRYVPSYGWFWQPGTTWTGWNTVPRVVNAPQHFSVPRPPTSSGQTLIVNRNLPAGSVGGMQGSAAVRGGSAGLGIARGSVRNLGSVSRQVERPASGGRTLMPAPAGGASRISAPTAASSAPRTSGGSASPSAGARGNSHK